MTNGIALLPLVTKAFAFCAGAPLLYLGVTMMGADLMQDISVLTHAHGLTAMSQTGLALGPVFVLVGISFLWPLRPFQAE